jgi:organic hydroperoxide reductase OsmC/OhrA
LVSYLCAEAGIAVLSYRDDAEGVMIEQSDGTGRFTRVTLRPRIVIRPGDDDARAAQLHREAHAKCFIANSINFPVICEPEIRVAPASLENVGPVLKTGAPTT